MKRSRKVFVSGPIHGMEKNQRYRDRLKQILIKHGFTVLDPWNREKVVYSSTGQTWWQHVPPEGFIKRDLEDIEKSDFLVAYLPFLSAGTCMELFYAKQRGKKTVVICGLEEPSPWIVAHADYLFKSIEKFKRFLTDHRTPLL